MNVEKKDGAVVVLNLSSLFLTLLEMLEFPGPRWVQKILFSLTNTYMLQELFILYDKITTRNAFQLQTHTRNNVMIHGYKIWSVAVFRLDFILGDQDQKWEIQH